MPTYFTAPLDLLTRGFFRGGWMLVAFLPLAQVLGRAVFNIVGAFYLFWGLLSLLSRRPKLDAYVLFHLSTLAVSFAISAILAEDNSKAFERWWLFVLYAAVCLPVLAAAVVETDAKASFVAASAASGILTITYLYVAYWVIVDDPGFVPEKRLREDNLPFLLPLILCAVQYRLKWRHRHVVAFLIALATTIYVVLSNGRAALIGLLVGIAAYGVLVLRWRLLRVSGAIAAIVVAAYLTRGSHIFRDASLHDGIGQAIDIVSSNRSELWLKAIQHPPSNLWFGTGMGNIPDSVLEVKQRSVEHLGHLHNFILDSWYETGIIGVALLALWLASSFVIGMRNWLNSTGLQAHYIGALLSASFAIVANASFSYSYASKQFAVYLFVYLCLARVPLIAKRHAPAMT